MGKMGIADALDIPFENVVNLTISEIGLVPGSRRLQPTQTKRYEVAYEVIPSYIPNSTYKVFIEKANRITEASTWESQVFRQALIATDLVSQVEQVVSKVAAHLG